MRRSRTHWSRFYRLSLMGLALVLSKHPQVYAEEVGSPAGILERGQWVMALGGGGLRKRPMKGGARVSVYQGGHFRGYGLTDRISLYGKIGGAYVTVEDPAFSTNPGGSNTFGANVFIDAQLKVKLWENRAKDWEWDGSVQYIFLGAPHKKKANQANWNEGQFATTLAKAFGRFKPYAGVKVSLLTFKYTRHGQTTQKGTYKPDSIVSPVVGMDWSFGENQDTVLNVEGSFLAGTDVAIAVTQRF